MTSRYLNPKIDHAFKRVFGERKNLLRSFLNAMLPLPEDALIESLEYLSPEQTPELPGLLKYSIVDVKCTDSRGRIFIVEMQLLWSRLFESRIVFGASQAYVKQLGVGREYSELRPVYALGLINESFLRDTPEFYHHYKIVRTGLGDPGDGAPAYVLPGLEFVLIELPKFKATNIGARKMQALWLRFMSEIGADDVLPDAEMLGNPEIAEALELMESAKLTRAQLDAYHASLDRARVQVITAMELERRGLEKGMEKGIALGIVQGLAEGKAKGKAEGKAEIIIAMASRGMTAAQIAEIVGITTDDVERIVVGRSQAASP
jgi:predicted transposase/invertase (TIGR01784 family)